MKSPICAGTVVFRFRLGNETGAKCRLQRRAFEQPLEQGSSQCTPTAGAKLHQIVERRAGARVDRDGGGAVKQPRACERGQVEDLIADRNAAAKRFAKSRAGGIRRREDFGSENRRPGRFAEDTQLRRLGSFVSSSLAGRSHRSTSAPTRVEVLFQIPPAVHVIPLQRRTALERLTGRPDDGAAFEHECHRVGDMHRLRGIGGNRLLERRRIRAMCAHTSCAAKRRRARSRRSWRRKRR